MRRVKLAFHVGLAFVPPLLRFIASVAERTSGCLILMHIAYTYKGVCCKSQLGIGKSVAYRSPGYQTLTHIAVRNRRCIAC
jgi:hypothetical protein